MAGGPLKLIISEFETGQSVTIADGDAADSNSAAGAIQYSPAISPFTDFNISGFQISSNRLANSTSGQLTQSGTVVRSTTTGGARTLIVRVEDSEFTHPSVPSLLGQSGTVTFTNPTASDKMTFQSFANAFNSQVVTLLPNLSLPTTSRSISSSEAISTTSPYDLANQLAVTLGASKAGTPGTTVRFQDTGTTTVVGTNGSIAGRVYVDTDASGSQTAGDLGLAGVRLTLTGIDAIGNPVSRTTTADASGNYKFSNVSTGTYSVVEDSTPLYGQGTNAPGSPANGSVDGDTISNIVVTGSPILTGYDFGETLGSLSGFVYVDADGGGSRGAGEAPIGGVRLDLKDSGGTVVGTTTTDSSGHYQFTGLTAGTYTIVETQPTGYADGLESVGTQGGVADPGGADDAIQATLAGGSSGLNNDFGELTGSLSGYVTVGTTSGPRPVADVVLTLKDGVGNVTGTATTDASGFYRFSGLMAGTYTIVETQPDGYGDGAEAIGSQGGTANPAGVNDVLTATLGAGVDGVSNDFAETLGSLAGYVYIDANNDGVKTVGEAPLAGVSVTLNDGDGNVVATTVTDSAGFYRFDDLIGGAYTVVESQAAGYLDGREALGTQGGAANPGGVNDAIGAELGAGAAGVDNNFGELEPASIAGTVYLDTDNDGVIDGGEGGISKVTIVLTGTDDLGNSVARSASTDTLGKYIFTDLRPGTYTVAESQPDGYLDGKDTLGTAGGTAADDAVSAVVLSSGTGATGYDFGELVPASLAGAVYVDANNDGIRQAGEAGIGSASLALTGVDDLGNPVSLTASTDATGGYSFTGLRPGTYAVTESQPAGYLDGKDAVGSLGGTLADDSLSSVVTRSGDAGADYNFGELPPSSISGSVYVDGNNDGTRQVDEPGITSVTVELSGFDDLGNPVSMSATTDQYGRYSFTGLRPGTYTVTESQPGDLLDGKDASGTAGGALGNDVISSITLSSGSAATGYTFGELRPASIAGSVYIDANNDGIRQAGEAGIGSASLALTGVDDLGNPVSLTASTDAAGGYSFTGLRPGVYSLAEAQPSGYLDGKDALGTAGGTLGADAVSPVSLGSGTVATAYNFGELQPAVLAGFVYLDANASGIKDAGDTGIGSVTVKLTGTDDLGNTVTATTITAADGSYSLGGLRPGIYGVTETQPAGYGQGATNVGTIVNGINPAAPVGTTDGIDKIVAISLGSGSQGVNYNFGEVAAGSISGTKYRDLTGNGFSADDTPLGGVTINLYLDKNGSGGLDAADGSPVATMASSMANGTYAFTGLANGKYFVQEVVPTGWVSTGPQLLSYYTVNVSGGSITTGKDFDNFEKPDCNPSNISYVINGTKTVTNLRGNVHAGDIVQAIFTIPAGSDSEQLTLVSYTAPGASFDASTAYLQQVFQASTGTFGPGTYSLAVQVPNSYFQVDFVCGPAIDKFGPSGGTIFYSAQNRLHSADNGGTQAASFNDSLAGVVYVDTNNDGLKQTGEAGIVGVRVTLTGLDYLGNAVSRTATTDSAGAYSFKNLLPSGPGGYVLSESQPGAYLDGKETVGSLGGSAGADKFTVFVNTNSNGSGYNFAELPAATITGYVYVDANDNSIRNSAEAGLSGVTLTLTGTDDRGAAVTLTTTTGANGSYTFGGLRPGTYSVTELQPVGYSTTGNSVGTVNGAVAGAIDSLVADRLKGISIGAGGVGFDYNFGEIAFSSATGSALCTGDTATIGFWQNKNGQALIKSLNGGSSSTNLATWLTTNFPNMFPTAKIGTTNSSVAAYFVTLFKQSGTPLEAQVMAVALAVYVTNSALAGNAAASYGFNVTAGGIASKVWNVGSDGATLGLANSQNYTILSIMQAANFKAVNGSLFSGSSSSRGSAVVIYNAINTKGDIR